jgi:hypothetical protein
MTDLVRPESSFLATPSGFVRQTLPARSAAPSAQFDRMGKWLELFIATEQVANVLARTAFVPEPMRGQPENIAAAMMKSLELGIDPLDGLSNLHVVKGKIGYSAEFMRRRIIEAGHEIEFDETTDDRCKIRGRRAGTTEWQTVVFTSENARKAKIQLGDYPADKLVARASSRLCRRVFPDVLAGATIVDELEDGDDVGDGSAGSAPVQRKRQPRAVKAKAEAKPAPIVDDDLLDEPEDDVPSESGAKPEPVQVADVHDDLLDDAEQQADEPDGPATSAQNTAINRLFKEASISDRDAKKHVIRTLIGYEITALTEAEANTIITQLEAWKSTDELTEKVWQIVDPPEMITDPQKTKLAIQRDERYPKTPKGRAQWFEWVATQINREVASNTELTKSEAHALIDLLEPEDSAQPDERN